MSKLPKTKVRKFVVEKTRNRKGWNSKFQDKPLLVTSETDHTVTVGKRVLHKKDVAEVPEKLATKLFQQTKTNARTPEYVQGQKKTIYKKDGRFEKENTEGAIAYQVDTLGEEAEVVKTSLQKRLAELREKSKIKKKIEAEKEKAEK